VCEIISLSLESKWKLFGRSWRQNVKSTADTKKVIERIKNLDQRIGDVSLERTPIIENSTVRMARLRNWSEGLNLDSEGLILNSVDQGRGNPPVQARRRLQQLTGQLRAGMFDKVCSDNLHDVDKCQPATSFIALSYCWHSQDWEVATSIRDTSCEPQKYRSPIFQKMLAAVSLVRKDDSEGVWIDRLCIDQANSAEKRIAIACMDIIYNSARLVIIVLEDIELSRDELRVWRMLREKRCAAREQNPNNRFVVPLDIAVAATKDSY